MRIEYFLIYGSIFSPMLPLVAALVKRKGQNQITTTAVIFISFSFAADLISSFLIRGNNYPFFHAYGLLEALILFYFFYLAINFKQHLFWILVSIFSTFYVFNSIQLETVAQFNSIGRSVECIIIIILSLRLFYDFYRREEDIFIDKSPLFWINVGILVYFSGAFFSFILSKEILSGPMPWMLHNTANILKNILAGIGLWKIQQK